MRTFSPPILAASDLPEIRRLVPSYEQILLRTMDAIIERFQRNGDYPFLDTKIDIFTGQDLSRVVGGMDIFGRDVVYSWIQSRGLESLCGHHGWIQRLTSLPADQKQYYLDNIARIIPTVVKRMEEIRRQNGGLFFWMDKEGLPFTFDTQSRKIPVTVDPALSNTSDEFHVKALMACAAFLKDEAMATEARAYFARFVANIRTSRVHSDQQPFDPKNPVGHVEGRRSHGVRMITLGGLAVFARFSQAPEYVETGLEFIRYILDNHVNIGGRFPELQEFDFVEFIDPSGKPFLQDGAIICDPGHALEFVGLGFKFLNVIRDRTTLKADQKAFITTCDKLLPAILLHAFELGYNKKVGGICKAMALNRRQPFNSDMPWWNLPETMRAAMFSYHAARSPDVKRACLEVLRKSSNAFLGNFINPDVYLMAYQTLDENGKPVKVIPATPDLDPGYHTGLSIIDFLDQLEKA